MILPTDQGECSVISPILQMRPLRPREVNELPYHDSECQSQGGTLDGLAPGRMTIGGTLTVPKTGCRGKMQSVSLVWLLKTDTETDKKAHLLPKVYSEKACIFQPRPSRPIASMTQLLLGLERWWVGMEVLVGNHD